MPTGGETFDFQSTMTVVWNALGVVVCNIGFQAALVGVAVACFIALLGFGCLRKGKRTGKPLLAVARKVTLFCACMGLPGLISLVTWRQLPPVNQLVINPLGLLGFWGLVTAHLCMEEMNFQWYADN